MCCNFVDANTTDILQVGYVISKRTLTDTLKDNQVLVSLGGFVLCVYLSFVLVITLHHSTSLSSDFFPPPWHSDRQRGCLRLLLRRRTQHQGDSEQAAGSRGTGAGRQLQLRREFAGVCRLHRHGHHLEAGAKVTDPPIKKTKCFHPLHTKKGPQLLNRPITSL